MKKSIVLIITLLVFLNVSLLLANGKWENDAIGMKYALDNGSYYNSGWHWIDSDGDGIGECYLFDEKGYIYKNYLTNDNLYLNNEGQLMISGVLQQKVLYDNNINTNHSESFKNIDNLINKFVESSNELLSNFTHEIKDLNDYDKKRIYKNYDLKIEELYSVINTKKTKEMLKNKISYEESKDLENRFKEKYDNVRKKLKDLAGIK